MIIHDGCKLARLHIVQGASIVLLSGICRRRLSSSVTLHIRPAGGFTRAIQAMTSYRLQSNYSSTVTLHGGPVVLRPVRATLCFFRFSFLYFSKAKHSPDVLKLSRLFHFCHVFMLKGSSAMSTSLNRP